MIKPQLRVKWCDYFRKLDDSSNIGGFYWKNKPIPECKITWDPVLNPKWWFTIDQRLVKLLTHAQASGDPAWRPRLILSHVSGRFASTLGS